MHFLLEGIIDFLALLFTAPYAKHVGLVEVEEDRRQCAETWEGMKRTVYGAFTNVMQFVLPFVTIIFCYTAIIRKLAERSAHRPGAPRYLSFQQDFLAFRRVKVVESVDEVASNVKLHPKTTSI